ncbi:hypothetical protein NQ317_009686, partial [Molorchus minor]
TLFDTSVSAILAFHVGTLLQFILLFKLSIEWPSFVKEWHSVEVKMKSYQLHCNLRIQVMCITLSIIAFAGVEHGLVNMYKILKCIASESTIDEAFRVYFINSYRHIFEYVDYSFWKGLIAQRTYILNLQKSFTWNYPDIFIMAVGWCLTFRLRQISNRLDRLRNLKVNDVITFRSTRMDFIRLTKLCDMINRKLSLIIFISVSSNLYFLLVQLFNSLGEINNAAEKIYFYTSLGLLLARTSCICFFGGQVYEEWMNICTTLFSIQSPAYNI